MAISALSILLAVLPRAACGDDFLQATPSLGEQQRPPILAELHEALGAGVSEDRRFLSEARLSELMDALRPTFAALPKNEQGVVGASTARYALHRLFVQQHGWQVKDLGPAGEAGVGAPPALDLGGRVPEGVRELFGGRLGTGGLDLHELAVLAATLEQLIHNEAVERLQAVYGALQLPIAGAALNRSQVQVVIDAYMASYILGANVSSLTPELVSRQRQKIAKQYPSWPATQSFLREVEREIAPSTANFTFASVAPIVEEIGERYGRWQGEECRAMKAELVRLEDAPGTGRVRLADFYGSSLHGGKWQFRESVRYLRQLGALDESEPRTPRVLIPNYINAPSNCIATFGHYAVCCIDECEIIIGNLERGLGASTATTAEIATLVVTLSIDALPGNATTLSAPLLGRLGDISAHHGGRVPLHGRLFGQWLHHAFPRECPYPHVSGTTRPMLADDWEARGYRVSATKEEMQQYYEASRGARSPAVNGSTPSASLMWTMEEELVSPHAHAYRPAPPSAITSTRLCSFALFLGVWSVVLAFARTLRPVLAPPGAPAGGEALAEGPVYSL